MYNISAAVAYINFIISFLGYFGNVNIIIATFIFRELHTRLAALIATVAALDIVNITYEIFHSHELLFGARAEMSRMECFVFVIPYLSSANSEIVIILFVGIDRLLSLSLRTRYSKINSTYFALIVLISALAFSTFFITPGLFTEHFEGQKVNSCTVASAYPSELSIGRFEVNVPAASFIIFIYLAYRYLLRQLNRRTISMYRENLKEVPLVATVMLSPSVVRLTGTFFILTAMYTPISKEYELRVPDFLSLLMLVSYSCNYYLILLVNRQYHRLFLRIFGIRPKEQPKSVKSTIKSPNGSNSNSPTTAS